MAVTANAQVATRRASRRSRRLHEAIVGYAFILPVVLGLLIWTFGPMLASAYYSLTDYNLLKPPVFVGLQNYVDLFTDDDLFIQSVTVTGRYVLMFVVASQILGLGLAMLLTRKVRFLNVFRTLFYLPIVIPYVAAALLWRYLFDKDIGPINAVLALVGIQGPSWLESPDWALISLVIISVWEGLSQRSSMWPVFNRSRTSCMRRPGSTAPATSLSSVSSRSRCCRPPSCSPW